MFDEDTRLLKILDFLVPKIIIIGCFIIILSPIAYGVTSYCYNQYREIKTIEVSNKRVFDDVGRKNLRIMSKSGETFVCQGSYWADYYAPEGVYQKLEVGKKYEVEIQGFGNSYWASYRNILRVSKKK